MLDDPSGTEVDNGESLEKEDPIPQAKPIDEDDTIISGHLPKIVYNNATKAFQTKQEFNLFVVKVLEYILSSEHQTKGLLSLHEFICTDIKKKYGEADSRITKELTLCCENLEDLKKYSSQLSSNDSKPQKRSRIKTPSKLELLYECYESKGIHETRELFKNLERSVKNQTLSLYVGMIQAEIWQISKDKSDSQLNRVRAIYDKALDKFGKNKAKLWYEYLQFEHDHAKGLEDFERINRLYQRAQLTLHPSKVDKLIEKYTLLQARISSAELEYSEYSDLED